MATNRRKLLVSFFCAFTLASRAIAGSFEAIRMDSSLGPQTVQTKSFETQPRGGYSAPRSMVVDVKATSSVTYQNQTTPISGGGLFGPTCFSLAETFARGSISESVLAEQVLGMNVANFGQATVFGFGDWVSVQQYTAELRAWSEKNLPAEQAPSALYGIPAGMRSVRIGPDTGFANAGSVSDAAARNPEFQIYRLSSSLAMFGNRSVDRRTASIAVTQLPYQKDAELAKLWSPSESELAWELGRARSQDNAELLTMFRAAVTQASKEATALGVGYDKAWMVVHSPDRAHDILYQRYGLQIVGKNAQGHSLLRASLSDVLANDRSRPSDHSERLKILREVSSLKLSEEKLLQLDRLITDIPTITLDYASPNAEVGFTFYDRTPYIMEQVQSLAQAYGIADIRPVLQAFSRLNTVSMSRDKIEELEVVPEILPSSAGIHFQIFDSKTIGSTAVDVSRFVAATMQWYLNRVQPWYKAQQSFDVNYTTIDASVAAHFQSLGASVRKFPTRGVSGVQARTDADSFFVATFDSHRIVKLIIPSVKDFMSGASPASLIRSGRENQRNGFLKAF
jgi:hypothetical protein